MAPVSASISGTKVAGTVDMLVATTRQPSGSADTLFGGERGSKPHLTEITVSIPYRREQGSVEWPKKLPPNPATDFAVTNVRQMETVAEGRAWFRRQANGSHALIFIHGFNNTYGDAVFRFAQIVHDSGMQATPVLFTWPSRAEITGYLYDKESTNYSRSGLEQALRTLAADPSVKDITVLAHSMGAWLAMEALRQMGIRDGWVNPKIKNVILASPDIDIQVFAKQYVEMGEPHPRFTIFMSRDDKALAASSFITGRVSRLGAINPAEEPYRSRLEKAGITAIDLTKVDSKGSLNHGKFAESPEIVQLIGQRLIMGQTLTDSNFTLSQGVTAVIGGTVTNIGAVAASAVAAPATIIERPASDNTKRPPAETTLDADLKPQQLVR